MYGRLDAEYFLHVNEYYGRLDSEFFYVKIPTASSKKTIVCGSLS
jgi:hypothetical protein